MRDNVQELEAELARLQDMLRNTKDEAMREKLLAAIREIAERLNRQP